MGGTFDPVHYGHLRTALEVKESLRLDEIRLVLCRQPPHRSMPVASPELRRIMLERAIENELGMLVDTRELERAGPSYTYDTLVSLRKERPDRSIALVLGMDAFCGLRTWYRWQELAKLTHFVVLRRPGYRTEIPVALSRLDDFRFIDRAEDFESHPAGCVYFQRVSQLEISSTAIREMIQCNRNARFLLPDPVLQLILDQELYR